MLMAGLEQALGAGDGATVTMQGMRAMLASHVSASNSPVDAACIHGDVYGTVSASTVIAGNGRLDVRARAGAAVRHSLHEGDDPVLVAAMRYQDRLDEQAHHRDDRIATHRAKHDRRPRDLTG